MNVSPIRDDAPTPTILVDGEELGPAEAIVYLQGRVRTLDAGRVTLLNQLEQRKRERDDALAQLTATNAAPEVVQVGARLGAIEGKLQMVINLIRDRFPADGYTKPAALSIRPWWRKVLGQ